MSTEGQNSTTAIVIALITTAGVICGALVTNWDKVFKNSPPTPSSSTIPRKVFSSPSQNQTVNNPLQVGRYEQLSKGYLLSIFQREERICIRVSSINGSTVASVHANSSNLNVYEVPNYEGWGLMQKNPTTIMFGEFDYTKDEGGFPQKNDAAEKKCLSSTGRFFVNTPRGEGSR